MGRFEALLEEEAEMNYKVSLGVLSPETELSLNLPNDKTMGTMDIQARKLEFIKEYLRLTDEKIINKLEKNR